MSGADPVPAPDGVGAGAIVFTDIVGYTELTELHGDDAALDLVDRHLRVATQVLPREGRVVKELGDGLLMWIPDADAALCAVLDMQSCFERDRGDELPLWVRIGMHWGTPRRRGDDLIGHDVNLASRVAGLAGSGEVLCTDVLARQATPPPGVALSPVGAVFVKGVADPVPLQRVHRG